MRTRMFIIDVLVIVATTGIVGCMISVAYGSMLVCTVDNELADFLTIGGLLGIVGFGIMLLIAYIMTSLTKESRDVIATYDWGNTTDGKHGSMSNF